MNIKFEGKNFSDYESLIDYVWNEHKIDGYDFDYPTTQEEIDESINILEMMVEKEWRFQSSINHIQGNCGGFMTKQEKLVFIKETADYVLNEDVEQEFIVNCYEELEDVDYITEESWPYAVKEFFLNMI